MNDFTANLALLGELAGMRPYLLRVARSRLRDDHRAEDVVQEALLAALCAVDTFAGRSRLRTWVTGILLHKVDDVFREAAREGSMRVVPHDGEPDDAEFDGPGSWRTPISAWADPEHALESNRFRVVFEAAIAALPPNQSAAFAMRELKGLDTDSICTVLGVTPNNLGVLLYRARSGLRRALDRDWFSRGRDYPDS
jgi:RNA polymerase sigma-70 factor (ECF subfamily)